MDAAQPDQKQQPAKTAAVAPAVVATGTTSVSLPAKIQFNPRSPSVKRILQELRELQREPSRDYTAQPLESNLFEWHFTIRGPADTSFEGGRYHGRILLPPEYPMRPPNIVLLTPNGRFELNKKICLSITGYHPEYWLPAWGIRTVMLGLISFLPTSGEGAVAALDYSDAERRRLAVESMKWKCAECGVEMKTALDDSIEMTAKSEVEAKSENNSGSDGGAPQFSFSYKPASEPSSAESVAQNESSPAPSLPPPPTAPSAPPAVAAAVAVVEPQPQQQQQQQQQQQHAPVTAAVADNVQNDHFELSVSQWNILITLLAALLALLVARKMQLIPPDFTN